MQQDLINRDTMLEALRRELVGPDPQGDGVDCTTTIVFEEPQQSYRPWRDRATGEEILQRDRPTKRYGIGVIYPLAVVDHNDAGLPSDVVDAATIEAEEPIETSEQLVDLLSAQAQKDLEDIERRTTGSKADVDAEDLDLTSAKYLSNVRRDMDLILASRDSKDCEVARRLGHQLKGSGEGYGFPEITRTGAAVELAAKAANEDEIRSQILALAAYLDRVEVVA